MSLQVSMTSSKVQRYRTGPIGIRCTATTHPHPEISANAAKDDQCP